MKIHTIEKLLLMKRSCILAILFLTIITKLSAQAWEVPADKKAKASPVLFNAETAKKGESIFQRNCQSCHGEPGKANYVSLTPSPGDPATGKFQLQTDGALFYKITTGRSPMPQFKDVLTEEERWQVIAYFRSFNKSYVQAPLETKGLSAGVPTAILTLTYNPLNATVDVLATDTTRKPLAHAEIVLFVKRYFGNLQIGEAMTTNEKGIASFDFPKDIPGDKKGNLLLIAKLTSGDADIKQETKLVLGIPTDKPPLTYKRAMWNVGKKAPIWLLLSYGTVVLVIWSFLGYIVLQLVKIRKANKQDLTIGNI